MKIIETEKTVLFKFDKLSKNSDINHFVSSRILKKSNYDLNISLESGSEKNIIIDNRKILSEAVKIPLENFVMQNQVHGNKVSIITKHDKGKGVYEHKTAITDSDAMITDIPGICLFIFAADCVPVLFFDTEKKVAGAAHSGWKGTVKNISGKTVKKMNETFGSKPENIIACIAPHISGKNYETGENVVTEVRKVFDDTTELLKLNRKTGKYHFNLENAVKHQLIKSGIPENNIETSGYCTFDDNNLFFSARKKDAGRFGAGIMIL
ncbi:MAG: peptidoglycan editing factor PgeF [Chlorobi bacterium]|nr:peptidoglycan editing factor PgeF [Chlorobiota bacterium]